MLRHLPKTLIAAASAICVLFSVRAVPMYSCQLSALSILELRSMIPSTKLSAGVSPSHSGESALGPHFYKISIDFKEPLNAAVQVILTVPDGRIFTHGHAGGYQWSDYIKDVRVTRDDGSLVPIHLSEPGQWEVQASKDEALHLSYNVDLSFTKEMREGVQRGGQSFGDSLYIVNRALFVMRKMTWTHGELARIARKIARAFGRNNPDSIRFQFCELAMLADSVDEITMEDVDCFIIGTAGRGQEPRGYSYRAGKSDTPPKSWQD